VVDGNGLLQVDLVDIAGSAVSTSSAQLGVNLVNWNGTAAAGTVPPDAYFIRNGTAQAGGATSITLDAGASATNSLYNNATILIRGGTGAGQVNIITAYVGSTKVATVGVAWATNPDNTSTFTIIADGPANVSGTVSGNVTQINGVPTSSVTTINANIGEAHAWQYDGNNLPKVDVVDIAGTASAGSAGYVGVDWGNVNAPTTTVGLTNTTISTSQVVASVTGAVGSVTAAVAITSNRKKAATATFEFLMQKSSDGSPFPGLTVASTISKDGGAPGATSNAVTEIGLGQYQLVLTATEMTANNVFLQMTAATAITTNISVQTQP
jgi:hypothetical protein